LNKSFSPGGNAAQLAAWAVVLLTLAQLCLLQLQPDSALKSFPARIRNPALALARYHDCDDFAAHSGPGNVFLKLVGCPKPKPDAEATQSFSDYREAFLSGWYFRTAYDLYPRRVFVAPAETVVNGGWDLMGVSFNPDQSWLSSHAVRSVLTLGFDAAGRTLNPHWEPLSGITNNLGGG
jgi:hypothetical protein